MAQSWEFKRVVWWLVHRVYNHSRHHNRNDFHSSLDSFVNLLHLQIVLYEDSTTILVVVCGCSTTSDIPAIFDFGRSVDQCVS